MYLVFVVFMGCMYVCERARGRMAGREVLEIIVEE